MGRNDDGGRGAEQAVAPRASAAPDASLSEHDDIRSWLDGIKQGWAARFAAAFEAVGIEDTSDLVGLGGEAAAKTGAKSLAPLASQGNLHVAARSQGGTGIPNLAAGDPAGSGTTGAAGACDRVSCRVRWGPDQVGADGSCPGRRGRGYPCSR